jgi:TRAP-type transport system small permease protein
MRSLLHAYYRFLRIALAALLGIMIVPVSLQIVSRYTDLIPRYIWTEEVARFCFVWMIMIGSMVAVRDKTHFDLDVLPRPKTPRAQAISGIVVHFGMLIMAVAFAWYGTGFARFGFRQSSEMSGINMLSIYIAFPVAGVTWVLFLLEKIVEDWRLMARGETMIEKQAAEHDAR